MVIFHCYVSSPEGSCFQNDPPYTGWSLERKHQKACDPRQGAGKASSWSNPWWHFHWDSVARQQSVLEHIFFFYKIRSFPTFSFFCTLGSISCTWLTLIEASEANCPSRSARRTKPISNCTPLTHMIWVLCPRTCDELWQDPSILKKYFKEYAECPEYVVQASVSQGFWTSCRSPADVAGVHWWLYSKLGDSRFLVQWWVSAPRPAEFTEIWTCGLVVICCHLCPGMQLPTRQPFQQRTACMGEPCNCDVALKVPEFLLFPRMAQRSLSQACNRPSAVRPWAFCVFLFWQVMTSQRSSLRTRNALGRKPSRPVTFRAQIVGPFGWLRVVRVRSGRFCPSWQLLVESPFQWVLTENWLLLDLDSTGRLGGCSLDLFSGLGHVGTVFTSESQDPDPNWYWLLR